MDAIPRNWKTGYASILVTQYGDWNPNPRPSTLDPGRRSLIVAPRVLTLGFNVNTGPAILSWKSRLRLYCLVRVACYNPRRPWWGSFDWPSLTTSSHYGPRYSTYLNPLAFFRQLTSLLWCRAFSAGVTIHPPKRRMAIGCDLDFDWGGVGFQVERRLHKPHMWYSPTMPSCGGC